MAAKAPSPPRDRQFEAFVRERLTWFERTVVFRRQLAYVPLGLQPENEGGELIEVLPAALAVSRASIRCLWVLTTKAVLGFEAGKSTSYHVIDGSKILGCQHLPATRQIRVSVVIDPENPGTPVDSILEYPPKHRPLAARFVALVNALSFADMWNQPEKFDSFVAEAAERVRTGDIPKF